MANAIDILVFLGGGLGAFLLGMHHLSFGLQSLNGERLRRFMTMATGKTAAGVATGIVSTIIVQSSSIISVMLIGFVSSGLMTLGGTIPVFVGANIGTTFTVWIMAFAPSPELLGLAFTAAGCFFYLAPFQSRLRFVGQTIVGLGLVFLGMSLMKEGVSPVRESERILAALQSLSATGLFSAALVALVAAMFTAVIQSSAAAIIIFMTLAAEGIITFETCVASLFGANIGTTMTGFIASLGGNAASKRTAFVNTAMNVMGSVLFLPLALTVLAPVARALFPSAFTVENGVAAGIMLPVAFCDTLFASLRAALTMPLARVLERLACKVIPAKESEKPHLSALNAHVAKSAVIACEQALGEIAFMAESGTDILESVRKLLQDAHDEETRRHVLHREHVLDNVQREITEFIGKILTTRLEPATAIRARNILRLADLFESISDEGPKIVNALDRLAGDGKKLAGTEKSQILDIHDRAEELFASVAQTRGANNRDLRERAKELKDRIAAAREAQLLRIGTDDSTSNGAILATLDILNAYIRIRSLSLEIAAFNFPLFMV